MGAILRRIAALGLTAAVAVVVASNRSAAVQQAAGGTVEAPQEPMLFKLPDPTPENIALGADWRSYCPFEQLGEPVVHPCLAADPDHSHPECVMGGYLENAARSPSAQIRRLAILAWGRLREGHDEEHESFQLVPDDPATGRPPGYVATAGIRSSGLTDLTLRVIRVDDARLLSDPDPLVRREAANAIGLRFSTRREDSMYELGAPLMTVRVIQALPSARSFLEQRLKIEDNADVAGTILETLGRLPFDQAQASDVEAELASVIGAPPPVATTASAPPSPAASSSARGRSSVTVPQRGRGAAPVSRRGPLPMPASRGGGNPASRALGAVRGLWAMADRNPKWPFADATVAALQDLAASGAAAPPSPAAVDSIGATPDDLVAEARRLALLALLTIGDHDANAFVAAGADPDWQVRRLAALSMNGEQADYRKPLQALRADPVPQVRVAALQATMRVLTHTGGASRDTVAVSECAAIEQALADPSPAVVLTAIDLVPANCASPERIAAWMLTHARTLEKSDANWQVPSRALLALWRIDAADAERLGLAPAIAHAAPQVRAIAAVAAGLAGDEAAALKLTHDSNPVVQTAALGALSQMKSAALADAARAALSGSDYGLLRAAALSFDPPAAYPAGRRMDIATALADALTRVTQDAKDTSRETRLTLVTQIRLFAGDDAAVLLAPFQHDFDPLVAGAAAGRVVGPAPNRRPPAQPAADELRGLPRGATIELDHRAIVELELLTVDAPLSVARFASLARTGWYNGTQFYQVTPGAFAQGGSPGNNPYAGDSRFLRDEVGLVRHLRGTVAMVAPSHDTGNGQFFINLIDRPDLDRVYTVFARITYGLDIADGLLEGATITSVIVR